MLRETASSSSFRQWQMRETVFDAIIEEVCGIYSGALWRQSRHLSHLIHLNAYIGKLETGVCTEYDTQSFGFIISGLCTRTSRRAERKWNHRLNSKCRLGKCWCSRGHSEPHYCLRHAQSWRHRCSNHQRDFSLPQRPSCIP